MSFWSGILFSDHNQLTPNQFTTHSKFRPKKWQKTIFNTIFVGKCFDSTSTLFYDFRCNYFIRDFLKCCSLTPSISDAKNAIRMSDFFSLKYLTISLTFDWRISDFRVQIIGKMQYTWEIRVQSFMLNHLFNRKNTLFRKIRRHLSLVIP